MLTRCLSCYKPFTPNQTLEHFPTGTRVAYDPARGRLWAVCPSCARWTLAPMETRWEVLETLEHLTSSPGTHLLKQGENIGLHVANGLEIIRVGKATLPEEVWWRYGNEFSWRRKRAGAAVRKGKIIDAIAMLVLIGIPYWGHSKAHEWIDAARYKSFGRDAWRGESHCAACGYVLQEVMFARRDRLRMELNGADIGLVYACPRCGNNAAGGHHFRGVLADHLLRRVVAYENFAGSNEEGVGQALSQLSGFTSPVALARDAAAGRFVFGKMSAPTALALEIALNSGLEETLLTAEVSELEARWRQEEELAEIMDNELTPVRLFTRRNA